MCENVKPLKQVNLEQLNEASMMTTQTDSVARFPNISMSFQDGSSTLLQDRGRVRRDPVSWLASPWTADLQKIIPIVWLDIARCRRSQKVPLESCAWRQEWFAVADVGFSVPVGIETRLMHLGRLMDSKAFLAAIGCCGRRGSWGVGPKLTGLHRETVFLCGVHSRWMKTICFAM